MERPPATRLRRLTGVRALAIVHLAGREFAGWPGLALARRPGRPSTVGRIRWPRGSAGVCHDIGMAYDEGLAIRLRDLLDTEPGVSERKMFGGLAMMLHGNMAVGVYGESLLVRVDPQEQEQLLRMPGVREFTMSGRAAKGFLVIAPDACANDRDLSVWVARGLGFAGGLPPK